MQLVAVIGLFIYEVRGVVVDFAADAIDNELS